jgi:hypothetical protein
MLTEHQDATLEIADPNAVRPARKQNALKRLLNQLQATGAPPLDGEEVLPAKLVGDGNYHWYPLAWTRWLVKWEQFKTLVLCVVLAVLCVVWLSMTKRTSLQVKLPQPSAEMLLKANKFGTFDRQQGEAFIQFAVAVANASSAEGMPGLRLLEGSIDPAIYLLMQQRQSSPQQVGTTSATEVPIYTIYVSKVSRWRYDPAKRTASAYVQGFRMLNTVSGTAKMEPYRAVIDLFIEPTSNRNRWGYYIQKFDEYYGSAADLYDASLQQSDRTAF